MERTIGYTFCLNSFKALVQGKCVKWHSDNQGAVRIVDIGSPNAELHCIVLDIFDFCRAYNVTLIPQWVPRELNVCADAISNIVDFDDWYTTQPFFVHLDCLWGPHTVDRFANATNTHIPRFNSRFRYRALKLLTLSQSRGKERIIGWSLLCIALLGRYNTSSFAVLSVL